MDDDSADGGRVNLGRDEVAGVGAGGFADGADFGNAYLMCKLRTLLDS